MLIVTGTVTSAISVRIAQRGSYAVAVPIVERMVGIIVVMVIVDGPVVVSVPSPSVVVPVRIIIIPSPAVAETVVVPTVVVIVWAVIIGGPPPVVSHINA